MDIKVGDLKCFSRQEPPTTSRLGSLLALSGAASRGMLSMVIPSKDQAGKLLASTGSSFTRIHSSSSSQTGDVILSIADSAKENKRPTRKEGQKTMEDLQADFVRLRKRYKAQSSANLVLEKQCKALQELCAKQRLDVDSLRDAASQSGSLSTTVCQLELELKSIKSSHDAISLQRMQSMLRCTEENTAAQLAALSRKAAAAQEAAESSQQQLSEAMQLHAQQMADAWATAEESQQQLTHASQAITELQQQLLDAEQMHLGQISLLQQEHAKQLAEIQACFSSRLATTGTELSEARAALCLTKDQHAKSAAQLQQQFDHAYAAEQSKHAMMLSASQAELIAARQQHVREMTAAEQQNQDQLTQALSQNSADLAQANTIYAADLAQVQTQHAADLQQAYLQYSEPQRSLQQASFQSQQSAELLSVEVQFNTVNQEHFANAVTTAGTGAQDPFSAQLQCSILAAELALLRQSLAASEKKLTHAQAEIVVHASTSVGRDEQICRLLSLQQGNMHPWKSPGHWKAVQLLIDSISTAVSKQQQADDMAAALCKQKQAENAKSAAVNRLKAEILSTMSMSESSCSTASLPRLDRHQPAEVATEAATVARDEAAGGLEPNAMSATALPQTIRSCDSPLALHNKGMPRAASPVQCCEKPLVTPVLPGYEAPVHGVKANVESGNSSWALAGNDATKAESSCVNYYPSDEDDLDDWTHEDDEADV